MILITHILIALSSVIFTSYVFLSPSKAKLQMSYGLVTLTLISGTALVVTTPAHMLQACVSGLIYVGIMTVAIMAARYKLARLTV